MYMVPLDAGQDNGEALGVEEVEEEDEADDDHPIVTLDVVELGCML